MQQNFPKELEPLVRLAVLILPLLENGRLERLIAKAELVVDLYIDQHKESVSNSLDVLFEKLEGMPANPFIINDRIPDPDSWLVPKEAWVKLGIKRSAFYKRLRKGDLQVYHLKGAETQLLPRVWLSRKEVEAYGKTHFPNQGKGRKKKPANE